MFLKCLLGDAGAESDRSGSSTTLIEKVDETQNIVTRQPEHRRGFTIVCKSFSDGAVRFFEGAGSVHETYMKRELSLFDVCIGPLNKKSQVVSLRPSATPFITCRGGRCWG